MSHDTEMMVLHVEKSIKLQYVSHLYLKHFVFMCSHIMWLDALNSMCADTLPCANRQNKDPFTLVILHVSIMFEDAESFFL